MEYKRSIILLLLGTMVLDCLANTGEPNEDPVALESLQPNSEIAGGMLRIVGLLAVWVFQAFVLAGVNRLAEELDERSKRKKKPRQNSNAAKATEEEIQSLTNVVRQALYGKLPEAAY